MQLLYNIRMFRKLRNIKVNIFDITTVLWYVYIIVYNSFNVIIV